MSGGLGGGLDELHDLSRVATVVLGVCNGGFENLDAHWTVDRPDVLLRWSISDVSLFVFVVYKAFDSLQYIVEGLTGNAETAQSAETAQEQQQQQQRNEQRVSYGAVALSFLALILLLNAFGVMHVLFENVLVSRDPAWVGDNYARHVLTIAEEASNHASYAQHAGGAFPSALSGAGALRRFGVYACGADDGSVHVDARSQLYLQLYMWTSVCLALDVGWVVSVLLAPCASRVDAKESDGPAPVSAAWGI